MQPGLSSMQLSAQDYAEIVAALQAADTDGSDKRRFTRMQVRGRIVVTPVIDGHAGTSYTALTRDISFKGAGIMQTIPVQIGQKLLVYFPRRGRPVLCVLCTVMHVRSLADGLLAVGCEFLTPAEPGASKVPEQTESGNEAGKDKPSSEPADAAATAAAPANHVPSAEQPVDAVPAPIPAAAAPGKPAAGKAAPSRPAPVTAGR